LPIKLPLRKDVFTQLLTCHPQDPQDIPLPHLPISFFSSPQQPPLHLKYISKIISALIFAFEGPRERKRGLRERICMGVGPREVRDETLHTHLDRKDGVDGEEVDYVFGYAYET
jgi:hypothetical protein